MYWNYYFVNFQIQTPLKTMSINLEANQLPEICQSFRELIENEAQIQ